MKPFVLSDGLESKSCCSERSDMRQRQVPVVEASFGALMNSSFDVGSFCWERRKLFWVSQPRDGSSRDQSVYSSCFQAIHGMESVGLNFKSAYFLVLVFMIPMDGWTDSGDDDRHVRPSRGWSHIISRPIHIPKNASMINTTGAIFMRRVLSLPMFESITIHNHEKQPLLSVG